MTTRPVTCPVCSQPAALVLDPGAPGGVRVRSTCGSRHAAAIRAVAECLPSDGVPPAVLLRELADDVAPDDPDLLAYLAESK